MYYSTKTKNISFLEMYKYLKQQGVKNNKFFLKLYNKELDGIDPYDPNLDVDTKAAIFTECTRNYWYFLREVVRIPNIHQQTPYILHRGNLAMNFGFEYNLNMFVEFSRLNYLQMSALCRYLWLLNFKASNCEILFNDKKFDDSKFSIYRLKELRSNLPVYLRMEGGYDDNGKTIRPRTSVDVLANPLNNVKIKAMPSARSEAIADNLGESFIQPLQWYNDFSFIKYNVKMYHKSLPEFTPIRNECKRNNKPYGILMTTTPNKLNTESGMNAYMMKQGAVNFSEELYDKSIEEIEKYIDASSTNNFLNLTFIYDTLGRDKEWYDHMCKMLNYDYSTIRREVLLEWF